MSRQLYWDDEVGDFPEWIHDPNDRGRWRELTVPDRWFVYAIYGPTLPALYIGMTGNLYRRLSQHAHSKPWWPHVDHIIVGVVETESDARTWENGYIRRSQPVHNIAGLTT